MPVKSGNILKNIINKLMLTFPEVKDPDITKENKEESLLHPGHEESINNQLDFLENFLLYIYGSEQLSYFNR